VLKFRSVVSRIIALHLLAIVVASICMPLALYMMLNYAAQELHHRALRERADEILRYLAREPDGTPQLSLPAVLAQFYSEAYGRAAFAVLDLGGHVLFSSAAGGGAIIRPRPQATPIEYFAVHRGGTNLVGVTITADIGGQRVLLQVSEDLEHRDVLIDDIVADFFTRVGWITAPILLLLLVIDVMIFRRELKPIVAASALAERIGPARTELRLPEEGMPQEVVPLVHAVNQALDRLEEGFRGQREFTADAAHELRTPLSQRKTVAVTGADHPVRVCGNADTLGRAIRNLVENALAHTGPGTTVEISVAAAGELRVMDRGPGVPNAERDQIFRRFWRRDRRRAGSAGLGLAIVKRIAEMHRATVSVADRPGGGAVFAIHFPAVIKADLVLDQQLETAF